MTSRHKIAAAALSVAAVAMAAGCGSSKSNPGLNQAAPSTSTSAPAPTTSTSTPTPTPSATPSADPTAKADADALTAYGHMVKSFVAEMNSNELSNDLLSYTQGDAYKMITSSMTGDQNGNIIYSGQPQSSPRVTATDLSANPPTVTITDCFGGPNWNPVYSDNIEGFKKGQLAAKPMPPYVVTVTVQNLYGHWLVMKYAPKAGSVC